MILNCLIFSTWQELRTAPVAYPAANRPADLLRWVSAARRLSIKHGEGTRTRTSPSARADLLAYRFGDSRNVPPSTARIRRPVHASRRIRTAGSLRCRRTGPRREAGARAPTMQQRNLSAKQNKIQGFPIGERVGFGPLAWSVVQLPAFQPFCGVRQRSPRDPA